MPMIGGGLINGQYTNGGRTNMILITTNGGNDQRAVMCQPITNDRRMVQ